MPRKHHFDFSKRKSFERRMEEKALAHILRPRQKRRVKPASPAHPFYPWRKSHPASLEHVRERDGALEQQCSCCESWYPLDEAHFEVCHNTHTGVKRRCRDCIRLASRH